MNLDKIAAAKIDELREDRDHWRDLALIYQSENEELRDRQRVLEQAVLELKTVRFTEVA